MASFSSCPCFTVLHHNHKSPSFQSLPTSTIKHDTELSFPGRSNSLQLPQISPRLRSARKRSAQGSKKNLLGRNATPEAAGDLASFSLPNVPGLSDNPWLAGIVGLLVGVPFLIQRLLTLTREVDMAAETVEKIADAVEKVAEEVDEAAENMAESLPEGGLKKFVNLVEDIAEETAKDAEMVEEWMDKVEEIDDKLEAFLQQQSEGTEKA